MEKPIIFFSHSSTNKDQLAKLKELIEKKTSSTIEIFLSSDGQSIPFGKNWIHKIELALEKAKLMFVFITPSSLHSHWIYFESGFFYGKGKNVIPIGLNGVDLGQLRPPLSLLQGFNVINKDSLNNIIHTLNKEFGYNYPLSFDESEFDEITASKESLVAKISDSLNSIKMRQKLVDAQSLNTVKQFLEMEGLEFNLGHQIVIPGLSIHLYQSEKPGYPNETGHENWLVFTFAPQNIDKTFPIADKIFKVLEPGKEEFELEIIFSNDAYLIDGQHRISSYFDGTNVKFSKDGNYLFKGTKFNLAYGEKSWAKAQVVILNATQQNRIDSRTIFELIEIILGKEIVSIREW